MLKWLFTCKITMAWSCVKFIFKIKFSYYPICPGHEVVGIIEEVGSKVTDFKKGDLAGCNPQRDWCGDCASCKKGENNICPYKWEGLYDPYFGGYSTHI